MVRLYGGWFIPPAMLKHYQAWKFADALSYVKYVFVGVSLNEYDGLVLACETKELQPPAPGGLCIIPPLMQGPFTGVMTDCVFTCQPIFFVAIIRA